MSSDDELEGEDEESFREHFAPVGRSLKRTITSRSIQAYAVSFVGLILITASAGPALIGGYATFQENFGLCGNPTIQVNRAGDIGTFADENTQPNLPHLEYRELTPDEQRAFRTALSVPNKEEEAEGNIEHTSAFHTGAIVTYRGNEYYMSIKEENKCVPFGVLPFPLGIIGLIVGAGLYTYGRKYW